MHGRTLLGREAEALVASYMQNLGFTILALNYRKLYGEIDIIAANSNVIAFIEVKMRRNPAFDSSEVIVPSKQKKIISVAKEYLARHNHEEKICRFDVALVEGSIEKPIITYLEDAFTEHSW